MIIYYAELYSFKTTAEIVWCKNEEALAAAVHFTGYFRNILG